MKWTTDWRARLESGSWVAAEDCRRFKSLLCGRRVYLASASPRRQEILRQCSVAHHVLTHSLEEPPPTGPDWRGWVRTWAIRKGQSASGRLKSGMVIAADTIVVLGTRGLGKPRDAIHAVRMLRSLSGKVHQVYTGASVIDIHSHRKASGTAVSHVRFRKLTNLEIDKYVATGEPLDKAGAYAIQGRAGGFIDQVAGPLDNIIGLPIGLVARLVERVLS